ncbi:MAG: hypothetical protein Q7S94_03155 [Gallionella sp.]|nr:hypothetical protein [Gallionella sp.]
MMTKPIIQLGDFIEITHLIAAARQRALQVVNTTLIDLYWQVGMPSVVSEEAQTKQSCHCEPHLRCGNPADLKRLDCRAHSVLAMTRLLDCRAPSWLAKTRLPGCTEYYIKLLYKK